MRSIPLTLLLALPTLAVPALAQHILPSGQQNCPVSISANRLAGGSVVSATHATPDPSAQGVRLILSPTGATIASAEIVVHALTLRTRAIPVGPDNTSDTTQKTFNLQRINARTTFTSDVWMNQVSGIKYIELISLTYTDGTTWHATSDAPCRAEPSGIVLVAHN